MRKFCLKIFWFTLILLFILSLIKYAVPFYWGRSPGFFLKENSGKSLLEKKMRHLLDESNNYDVLFFGSSRTFRHIDPLLFDSITGFNSFNAGVASCFYLETHYLIDHFLEQKDIKDSLIIIIQEVTPQRIVDKNLHSIESKYFLDATRLKMGLSYYSNKRNYKQIYNHLISYLENKLCIGQIRMILYNINGMSSKSKNYLSKLDNIINKNKGFLSIEEHLSWPRTKYLEKRRKKYLQSKRYKENILKALDVRDVTMSEYKDHNLNLQDKKVIVYTLPSHDLGREFHFDRGHYNNKGARIITEKMAEYFVR